MKTSEPKALIELLQKKMLRIRTGIWLMPVSMLGKEADHAARLNIDAVDIRDLLLNSLPQNTRYLGLNSDRIIHLLQEISDQIQGSECLLVSNLDVLLAKLSYSDVCYVWQYLFDTFPNRRHALILAMPEGASHLLPEYTSIKTWNKDKRLASTNIKDY
jgi:hypothetical protein